MCVLTWETDYKIVVVKNFVSAIVGTIALSGGRNVAGCAPLWGWTVAVVVLVYWGCLSMLCSSPNKFKGESKKYNKYQIIGCGFMWKIPTIVLFIMGLIVVGDGECREKWEDRNALLLYYGIVNGAIWFIYTVIELFFHEWWREDDFSSTPNNNPEVRVTIPPPITGRDASEVYPPAIPPYQQDTNPHYLGDEGH